VDARGAIPSALPSYGTIVIDEETKP